MGMTGISWGGSAALQAAINRPKALKAIIPVGASVDRYYDDPGTLVIRNYFGKNAITYDLERAINEGKLVEYFYYPKYLELESDELQDYREYSADIAICWAKIEKLKKQK